MRQYKSKTIKDDDIKLFFSKLKNDSLSDLQKGVDLHYRYYICFSVIAGAGLRAEECLNLKFSDLAIESIGNTNLVVLTVLGKGSKLRDVLLPLKLSNLLFDYEKYCLKSYFHSEKEMINKYLIFRTMHSQYLGRYSYKWLYKTLRELLLRYNINNFNLHRFRHTYASKISEMDTLVANQLLGHSKMETTKIYLTMVDRESLLKSVKVIDDIFE